MTVSNTFKICFGFGIFFLIFLGLTIQNNLLINCDVSYYLNVAGESVANGKFLKNDYDVFPINIFLYFIPIFLTQWIAISAGASLQFYVTSIALFSLLLTYFLLRKIYNRHLFLILLLLTGTFFILPLKEFAQREHLALLLLFPYFCLAALRLKNEKVNDYLAVLVGVMAGIGLQIKIFFLIIFGLVELFLFFKKKSFAVFWRPEFFLIITITVLDMILIYFGNNLEQLLPQAKMYYGKNGLLDFSFSLLLIRFEALFCFSTVAFYFIVNQKNDHSELDQIIIIALIGFLASYFLQLATYYYRILPAFNLAIILNMIIFLDALDNKNKIFIKMSWLSMMALLVFANTFLWLQYSLSEKTHLFQAEVVKIINDLPTQIPTYFIAANDHMPYPLQYYIKVKQYSHFYNHWWIGSLVKQELHNPFDPQLRYQKNYYFKLLTNELENIRPTLIFVDTNIYFGFQKVKFDYIAYLNQNEEFKKIWRHYRFLQTADNFLVFKRITP